MGTYFEVLTRWGVPVSSEDLTVPPAAQEILDSPERPSSSSLCYHGAGIPVDYAHEKISKVDHHWTHYSRYCRATCPDTKSEHYPQYLRATSLMVLAEGFKTAEVLCDTDRDMATRAAAITNVTHQREFYDAARAVGVNFGAEIRNFMEESLSIWAGHPLELFERLYSAKFDFSLPEVYAVLRTNNQVLSMLLEKAFTHIGDGIFRLPRLRNGDNFFGHLPGRFGQDKCYGQEDAMDDYGAPVYYGTLEGLSFRVLSSTPAPSLDASKLAEFHETLITLTRTDPYDIDYASQSAQALTAID